ncbi:MAG: DUF4115 domain-containing protein [Rhodobacteraceae bacterium]|nr:DUF4115 domain-containing protein [Paracoccaceae bacterium]
MIGRRHQRDPEEQAVELKSFDDYDLRLGDVMRGERATMGKSLLDVQRELRIKAAYIAAIENADPSAFDTPGFIAGYVRSYARYLGMNPDEAFDTFCAESGFSVAHGMSAEASGVRNTPFREKRRAPPVDPNPFGGGGLAFRPPDEGFFAQIEPRAIGSSLVLVLLIGALGFGGWSVLKQVQQVTVAPVDQTPIVLSDIDPLAGAVARSKPDDPAQAAGAVRFAAPTAESLDRLYRPQALDVPVLVARDAPIATLDPRAVGALQSPEPPRIEVTSAPAPLPGQSVPRVVEEAAPQLRLVAVRPAWIRVRAADGSTVFEATLQPGDVYEVPQTEVPPTLRVGDAGAVYFQLNGEHYGPVGTRGAVVSNVALAMDTVGETYTVADLEDDRDLARVVAEANTGQPPAGN